MKQLSATLGLQAGNDAVTTGGLPAPISKPASRPPSPHQIAAAKAADRLFDLLPPLDVSDPQAFMTAVVAIFAAYPPEVWEGVLCPVMGIPGRTPRPTLADIKAACDRAYEPIERQIERQRAEESYRRGLPPPSEHRTPEQQARAEQQVIEARRAFDLPPDGRPRDWKYQPDGRHNERVAADLAARKGRNEQPPPPAATPQE